MATQRACVEHGKILNAAANPFHGMAEQNAFFKKHKTARFVDVTYDSANGPLLRGQDVEPDPDVPGEYIRKTDFK